MVIQVVKRNGKTEPFQRKKIVDSCIKAGAPADVAASIADEIAKSVRDMTPTSEIRTRVLSRLGKIRKEWVKSWTDYGRTKKKK